MSAEPDLSAAADIKAGRVRPTVAQQPTFLDAVEELARVLINPALGDSSAQLAMSGRTPALADAGRPGHRSLAHELEAGVL